MRPNLYNHTEGKVFQVLFFAAIWLIASIGFTTWWSQFPLRCIAVTAAFLALMKYVAMGPSAKYLPENASVPSDFATRELQSRPWAGRVIVITGSNSGIGFETVKSCAFLGAHVVMVDVESDEKNEAARQRIVSGDKHASVVSVRMDIGDLDNISKGAWEIVQAACKLRKMALPTKRGQPHPCIDILVNNAGIASTTMDFTKDGFTKTFQVNYCGAYILTEWLLPYIVNGTGRIINIASCAHTWWTNYPTSLDPQVRVIRVLDDVNDPLLNPANGNKPYAISKWCNLIHACVLAKRLKDRGIVCASLHPGAVWSEIWRFIPYPLRYVFDFGMLLTFKNCYQGHQTTLHCLTAGNIISGQFYADCGAFRPRDEALDAKNHDAIEAWTRDKLKKWLPDF